MPKSKDDPNAGALPGAKLAAALLPPKVDQADQRDIEDRDRLGQVPSNAARIVEVGGVATDRLRSFVLRVEDREEEIKNTRNDIKDIFEEAKSAGFNVKALRRVIKNRKRERKEVEAEDNDVDLYERALQADESGRVTH